PYHIISFAKIGEKRPLVGKPIDKRSDFRDFLQNCLFANEFLLDSFLIERYNNRLFVYLFYIPKPRFKNVIFN
ncbi:TPA: hypothetical protein ACU18W_002387, partial [Mannheimia haemolytica]